MKDDDVWEEKYSSDTLTRRKITVWIYNQKNKEWQKNTSCSTEFISVLLNCSCCEFLLLNVVVAYYGVEDIKEQEPYVKLKRLIINYGAP